MCRAAPKNVGTSTNMTAFIDIESANQQIWHVATAGPGDPHGYSAGTFYLDNEKGKTAFRISPGVASGDGKDSNNAIAGHFQNGTQGSFPVGNTVAGGGATGLPNVAGSEFGTVGGGTRDIASACATVGGGFANKAQNTYAVVGGGTANTASGERSTVAGGESNKASAESRGRRGGGTLNVAQGTEAFVGGGRQNVATGRETTPSSEAVKPISRATASQRSAAASPIRPNSSPRRSPAVRTTTAGRCTRPSAVDCRTRRRVSPESSAEAGRI